MDKEVMRKYVEKELGKVWGRTQNNTDNYIVWEGKDRIAVNAYGAWYTYKFDENDGEWFGWYGSMPEVMQNKVIKALNLVNIWFTFVADEENPDDYIFTF